ncbi:MAG: glutathione S-transferase [Solirubrobacterales bacterium]|nr:glutathione S-transferase [Solirubrobacterales bacterium]
MPAITLHVLPPSHPCMAVEAALKLKGLEYERVALQAGPHVEEMTELYGKHTVPGMLVDGDPVHGSRAIYERLDELVAEPALLASAAVGEAEAWGDRELQDLGRRLPWGAMHFRPEALGTFGGAEPLDPAGTDFALKYVRASWKYHKITAVQLAEDLTELPAKLDHADALIAEGTIGGEKPNAADFQIASTLRILLCLDDLAPLMAGRPLEELARRLFPDYPGRVPAGAFPAGWVPERG